MVLLSQLKAREVLDSRGRPTVEVEARADGGASGLAIVPTGGGVGRHEARELTDGDPDRFGGLGVRRAVDHVEAELAPALAGMDLDDQAALDARLIDLDGTPDKSRLGANALYGASMAAAKAAAEARHEPLHVHLDRLWRRHLEGVEGVEPSGPELPLPLIDLIAGGPHLPGRPDFRSFQAVPIGARHYSEAVEMGLCLHHALAEVLRDSGEEPDLVAGSGGYGPPLRGESLAVERILEAALRCGLTIGRDVAVALDAAATRLLDPETGRYVLKNAGEEVDADGLIEMLEYWARQYPIASIEDGLAEDDWAGWTELTRRLGGSVQVAGDDLFATRSERIEQGATLGAANAVVIKPSRAGTLTEAFDAIAAARRLGYRTIVAARSGETEDCALADLAVATAAGQVKLGGLSRSERLAKYNRLLRIESELGDSARFAGRSALAGPAAG